MNITQSRTFCVPLLLSLFREIQRRIFFYNREFQEPNTNHKRRFFHHRNDYVVELTKTLLHFLDKISNGK